ncbi:leucyl aminopeptidase [Candidatus Woesearchaeota archaeon]|nr:leucyl aminopeptidase [Candidatus Woesearchaeota archaeon]
MKITILNERPGQHAADALILLAFEDAGVSPAAAFDPLISALSPGDFSGKLGQVYSLLLNKKIARVFLTGLGKKAEFSAEKLRKAVRAGARAVRSCKLSRFSILCEQFLSDPVLLGKTIAESLLTGLYTFDKYLSDNEQKAPSVDSVTLLYSGASAFAAGVKEAEIVCASANRTRDLVNEGAAVITPRALAQHAQSVAKQTGFSCTVLDAKAIAKQNMAGVQAVAKGSGEPPTFTILEYNRKAKETVVLVGKGVCFDSGGLGIKPGKYMWDMKIDMAGAATVLGIIEAAARLQLPYHIIALMPAVENMTGGKAYKPGDILKYANGKTVEVMHTDAEGRLILADALIYAGRFSPDIIIDFATLTGACVVALGTQVAGIMGNNDALVAGIQESGLATYERVWQLPLYEEYTEQIKGQVSDLQNLGGWAGNAGTITAGAFLKEFVPEKAKWAHIDIAGTAFLDEVKDKYDFGATGFGVRLIIDWMKRKKR